MIQTMTEAKSEKDGFQANKDDVSSLNIQRASFNEKSQIEME